MPTLTLHHRLTITGCTAEEQEALRREFTYDNPERRDLARLQNAVKANPRNFKLRGMLATAQKAPPEMATYVDGEDGSLSLARGSVERAQDVLATFGRSTELVDQRSEGDPWLGPVRGTLANEPWDFQHRMLEAALAGEQGMVLGETGCIVGTARIGLNRAGKGFTLSLAKVVSRFNDERANGRKWDLSIPTFVRSYGDGFVRLSRLIAAKYSGDKPVYRVTAACGYSVEATADHEFLTADGWKRLEQLTMKDFLLVEQGRRPESSGKPWKPKAAYRVVNGLRAHPFAGRRTLKRSGWSVPMHRLVAEARQNGISYEQFVQRVRDGRIEGLQFIDPDKLAVHHLDENPMNNEPTNLLVEDHFAHKRRHAANGGWKHLAVKVAQSRVVEIVSTGVKPTYDLTVETTHNFVANGLVVHNCGKTQFGFMLANAVKVPVIVLVHSSALMADWIRRAREELQLRPDDIGEIQGSTRRIRPLTIAMVQTVVRHGREFASKFGCVIADEIEKFAAKSLYESADLFPARYRIGIGADFKRKDGKEFLTADLFGGVLLQVSREEIGDKILDVEHRLFETGWAPDWYTALPRAARGYAFNQLVDSAMASKERNALLARVAGAEVASGNPVLAFSHRREHVRLLEADLRQEVPNLAGTATGVMLGGKADQVEFDRCTAGFRAGTLKFAGTTYMAASVGINLPSLPVGICATPTHSNPSRLRQTQGRLRRIAKGKDTARLYVPWDRGCFGLAPVRASLRLAPEKTFVLVEGKWVNARDFLRTAQDDERESEADLAGDLFTAVR